jgi:hypothetical protein
MIALFILPVFVALLAMIPWLVAVELIGAIKSSVE